VSTRKFPGADKRSCVLSKRWRSPERLRRRRVLWKYITLSNPALAESPSHSCSPNLHLSLQHTLAGPCPCPPSQSSTLSSFKGLAHTPPTCQSQSSIRYPWTLVAAKLESIRETWENLKRSMTVGAPPTILSNSKVCECVGFKKYWEREERYF
jgi:hypothetical protein